MTIAINIALAIVVLLGLRFFLSGRLLDSPTWRATVTPLASIIGSGFLVSVPLLANEIGYDAVFGMAGLVLYAYLAGGAIRFNIIHGEPIFADEGGGASDLARRVERLSHMALAGAYWVSVAYYLSLLGIFLLKIFGVDNEMFARLITSGFLAFIGIVGFVRGLHGLERLEEYAVSFNLASIVTILVALAGYNIHLLSAGRWHLPSLHPAFTVDTVRALLGFVIVVQGFEMSRFLAGQYEPEVRVRTMRYAQLISAVIYLVFFSLATVMFKSHFSGGEVAAIIDMVGVVAVILPLMLTGAAVASQFSASVADAIGGAGLLHDAFERPVPLSYFYPLIAVIAIALVWTGNVFDIIALASRAFAFFYFMQCVVAGIVTFAAPDIERRGVRAGWFAALALLSLVAAVFGVPASA